MQRVRSLDWQNAALAERLQHHVAPRLQPAFVEMDGGSRSDTHRPRLEQLGDFEEQLRKLLEVVGELTKDVLIVFARAVCGTLQHLRSSPVGLCTERRHVAELDAAMRDVVAEEARHVEHAVTESSEALEALEARGGVR